MTDYERNLEHAAKQIVTAMWTAFGPAVEQLFRERMVEVAAEKYRFAFEHDELLTEAIGKKVAEMLATTFKPALDEIAHQKARAKVKRRAEQNRINPATLPGMKEIP